MRYLSLFSGIETATNAWHPLGWEPVAFSEIEPYPCAVLASRFPSVPNLGDVTAITEALVKSLGRIDLVVFGSPCQDLSVAGKRRGLRDVEGNITRSGLFFDAINIAHWARKHCGCRFALWENVPGAFSSGKGADFAQVVSLMAGLDDLETTRNGWGSEGIALGDGGLLEWAVLDAQFFGLAQRRKRVFALVDFGDWQSRPPILLERESLRGDTPPSRKTREDSTRAIASGATESSGSGTEYPDIETLCAATGQAGAEILQELSPTLTCAHEQPIACICLGGNTIGRRPKNGGNGGGFDSSGVAYTLTKTDVHAVCFTQNSRDEVRLINKDGSLAGALASQSGTKPTNYLAFHVDAQVDEMNFSETHTTPLTASQHAGVLLPNTQVRRLTPIECARLQGFPDKYLDITFRGKPAADSHKYKALGNSMAVPVMHWIGKKIQEAVLYQELNEII